MKALRFIAQMPLIIGIMVWTRLRQGLRALVAEYRDFNPGSSTWK